MSEPENIEIGNIPAVLVRKPIRHVYIRVYPPDGRVVVSAPRRMSEKTIKDFISSKHNWIIKQHQRLKKVEQERQKGYESGEYHLYEGKRYLLEIRYSNKQPMVFQENNRIVMVVKPGYDKVIREKILDNWYRDRMWLKFPLLLEKWEKKMNVKVSELRIRKMRTKWGTCNAPAKRIWLSLELAKYPDSILEYILVHEMVHLLERKHTRRFYELMNIFLPGWKERKKSISYNPD